MMTSSLSQYLFSLGLEIKLHHTLKDVEMPFLLEINDFSINPFKRSSKKQVIKNTWRGGNKSAFHQIKNQRI